MIELYFAYGSNMKSARLRERIPSVQSYGIARLPDRRLVLNKRGRDGSAKANLEREAGAVVWGVVYEIAVADWPRLDDFEGGYQRVPVSVLSSAGVAHAASTYVSNRRIEETLPYDWYLALLLDGAREHGLPEAYLDFLASLPSG